MKNYKIILFIFLILFTGMSCVDAMDINNMDNVTIDKDSVSVVGMDDSSGSFSNLQNEIDICENNDFKLTKNYEYSSTEKPYDGISIFKDNFTVDGQGHTIKGNGKSKMFDIRANNVTIKNINFINGYSEFYGGAIFFDGSGLIENCTFKNNIAQLGGAIFIRENVTVKNSIFMNNIAESGGAINFLNNGIIENCSFENNTDSIHDANDQYNGAIFCEKGKEHIIITNCYFDHIKEPSIFEYSILIPNYVNVTNIWRIITGGLLKEEYIASPGVGGKVKMPVNREYIILTHADNYTYSSNDLKSKNILLNIDELSNLTISSNSEYTKFTYSSFIHENVNQISAVFRQKEVYGILYPDYEELLIVFNGDIKASIGFSNPVSWDESGVRMAFSDNNYGHFNDMMWCRYDTFNHYDLLTFAETGELVEYNTDMLKINNFPTKEKITTQFKMNGTSIIKDEWVGFGYAHDCTPEFDVLQSYVVSNILIDDSLMNNTLNQVNNSSYDSIMNLTYNNFLVALSTIWLYDNECNRLADFLNVTFNRQKYVISISGIEFDGRTYVHCPDPIMGINSSSDIEKNKYIFDYTCSLLLSELESQSLSFTGVNCTSGLNRIFSGILNHTNFTVAFSNNLLVITLNNNNNKFVFDLENGTVYDLSIFDNFNYKGAVNNEIYCYDFSSISNTVGNIQKKINFNNKIATFELSNKDKEFILYFFSELSLALGVVALDNGALLAMELIGIGGLSVISTPIILPIAIATGLILIGFTLKYYEYDGNIEDAVKDTITSLLENKFLVLK